MLLYLSLINLITNLTTAWDVPSLVGIWKLATKDLPHRETTILGRAFRRHNSFSTPSPESKEEILLKLNPDGTFRQCNEGYVEGSWIGGRWALVGPRQLRLSLNRQYYGPPIDIALKGLLQKENSHFSVVGTVYQGKVVLPRSDPNYFRQDLADEAALGPRYLAR